MSVDHLPPEIWTELGVGADPYLEPADSIYTLFEYEVVDDWPALEVCYAPLGDRSAIFVIE